MRRKFLIWSAIVVAWMAAVSYFWPPIWWLGIIVFPTIAQGLYDMFQTRHTVVRNFPLAGRLRYFMELLRPKLYQYFVESDVGGRPFNRINRSVIYQRAKGELDTTPFGTQYDVYEVGYEWMNHSLLAHNPRECPLDIRVKVGGPLCSQPYNASIFNISAMSYGALSKNAIMALNQGAQRGNFAHNTGEGGISPYHLQGGDLIWQIGTGYFGCRDHQGRFSPELFAEKAGIEAVKMIEVKLSQGAKPGHGGILPAAKNTPEIAAIRNMDPYTEVVSPPRHTAFDTPIELLYFIQHLRELAGGKPVGFKLSVGHLHEFMAICKAMLTTEIYPDFITVDGGEGGTGAAPLEYSNFVGMPLTDALVFVSDCLQGFDLKQNIRLIASGKIVTGFDILKNMALGADMANSARGMMMALGCIQALECNKNTCPTGITTQDPQLVVGLVVENKEHRVARYHAETVKAAAELLSATGLDHPEELTRAHINRRISPDRVMRYDELFPPVAPGSFLDEIIPPAYRQAYELADPYTFAPQGS